MAAATLSILMLTHAAGAICREYQAFLQDALASLMFGSRPETPSAPGVPRPGKAPPETDAASAADGFAGGIWLCA